jgi:hypothetical protein
MDRVTLHNLRTALVENVSPEARVITDSLNLYGFVTDPFSSHETVDHTKDEYVRGDVYTNTVESSFSLLKRGIYGTFHNVSKRHLHRYCGEFDFRWNTRRMDDGARSHTVSYRQTSYLSSTNTVCPMNKPKPKPEKRGPKPEILKIRDLNWKEAVKRSFDKKKPPDGWPKN